jgi:hypothetical protein
LKQPFNVLRTPQPVYDPITAAITAAVGAQAGSFAAAAIGFGVNIAVSAVASYALNALSPKPKILGGGGFLVNEVNPTAPAEYVYGEVRKGGVVTYDEATDGNAILHRIIVLAAGEHEVGDIYLNDEVVDISGNDYDVTDPSDPDDVYTGAGWVITEKWMEDNRIREPRIRIFVHDGSQTATTDTFANSDTATLANTLIADSANGLDSNFVGKGLTYLYVQMNIDAEVFAGGIPRITANVKRKGIYDPRDDSTKITSNWALCLADYLQADYGLGDTGSVDSTALSAEANLCDEAVALDAGGTQPRYEMNGVFRADETPGQILSRMMPSGSGQLFWGQGKWQIRAGEYAGSIASFDLSDLRSGIQVETRAPRAQNYNAIRGVFNDKSQRYIEGEYPRISSSTFLAVDGGFENVLDYDLPFETDGIRAQRLAKLALFRQREQIRVEADFNMRAASVQPGDVIDLTIDRYGWDAKEFEVVGWTLKISESGTLCVRLSLKETSEAAFDWTSEESVFDSNNTNLPDRFTVPTVDLGTPTVSYVQNPGGTEQPLVTVPWTVTSPGLVSDYVFEWRDNDIDYASNGGFVELGGSPTVREQAVYDAYLKGLGRVPDQDGFDFYVSGGGSALTPAEVLFQITNSTEGQSQDNYQSIVTRTTRAELRTLSFDQRYDFRVYARNARGVRSATDATTFLVEVDTSAPGLPTAFTATGGFRVIRLKWTNPTDNDLAYVEVWEAATNSVGAATKIAEVVGDSYARTNLGISETKWYFLQAVDYAGNVSGFTTGFSATTTFIDDEDFENGIRTLFEDQGLFAIEDVASLPASGDTIGQQIYNRSDGKLYRWNGTSWDAVVAEVGTIDFSDLSGTLSNAQVAVNSINGTKITDNTITTNQIAARTIVAGDIATGTISANEIAALTITGDKISGNTITGAKIAAGTITGDKITANTITGGLIAASGVITNSAQINNGLITNAKIANAAITNAKIGTAAVDRLNIAGNAATAADFDAYLTGVTGSGSGTPSASTGVGIATITVPASTTAELLLIVTFRHGYTVSSDVKWAFEMERYVGSPYFNSSVVESRAGHEARTDFATIQYLATYTTTSAGAAAVSFRVKWGGNTGISLQKSFVSLFARWR